MLSVLTMFLLFLIISSHIGCLMCVSVSPKGVPAFFVGIVNPSAVACLPQPISEGIWNVLQGNGQSPGSSESCSSGVSRCHNTFSPSGSTVCISVSHLALQVKKRLPRCFKFVLIKRGLVYVCPCLSWKQSFVFPLAARRCLNPSPLLLFLCCEL